MKVLTWSKNRRWGRLEIILGHTQRTAEKPAKRIKKIVLVEVILNSQKFAASKVDINI